ncbi:hypothetical protein [Mesorhizobium sp. M0408]|uniref:hypothetical protein n=1 Tax=unclassified Mesorhizobium TaxID=325217 RepID=UPI00333BED2A
MRISEQPGFAGTTHEPSHANLSGDWHKPARIGLGVVVLTFGILGGWASLASLDSAVVASVQLWSKPTARQFSTLRAASWVMFSSRPTRM